MKPLIALLLLAAPVYAQVSEDVPQTTSRKIARCSIVNEIEVGWEKENQIYRKIEGGKKFVNAVYADEDDNQIRGSSQECWAACKPIPLIVNHSCGYYYTACMRETETTTAENRKKRVRTWIKTECKAAYWDIKTGKRLR